MPCVEVWLKSIGYALPIESIIETLFEIAAPALALFSYAFLGKEGIKSLYGTIQWIHILMLLIFLPILLLVQNNFYRNILELVGVESINKKCPIKR